MTEQICKNGFDKRCGFEDLGDDARICVINRAANKAMNERMKNHWYERRPKISHVLKYQKKIPHVVGHFIMRDGRACALGVLHLKAGGRKCDKQPDWNKIESS